MDMLLAAIIVYCVDRHLTGMSLSGGFISYFFFLHRLVAESTNPQLRSFSRLARHQRHEDTQRKRNQWVCANRYHDYVYTSNWTGMDRLRRTMLTRLSRWEYRKEPLNDTRHNLSRTSCHNIPPKRPRLRSLGSNVIIMISILSGDFQTQKEHRNPFYISQMKLCFWFAFFYFVSRHHREQREGLRHSTATPE